MSTEPKHVIILGGGFAGVYTARCLEKLLRPAEASITLINREHYWVYQPMLPEQGDLGSSVYFIEEGECEALREQKGERELLATLSRGEYFGEMALLSDRTGNATIRARTAMNVLII